MLKEWLDDTPRSSATHCGTQGSGLPLDDRARHLSAQGARKDVEVRDDPFDECIHIDPLVRSWEIGRLRPPHCCRSRDAACKAAAKHAPSYSGPIAASMVEKYPCASNLIHDRLMRLLLCPCADFAILTAGLAAVHHSCDGPVTEDELPRARTDSSSQPVPAAPERFDDDPEDRACARRMRDMVGQREVCERLAIALTPRRAPRNARPHPLRWAARPGQDDLRHGHSARYGRVDADR